MGDLESAVRDAFVQDIFEGKRSQLLQYAEKTEPVYIRLNCIYRGINELTRMLQELQHMKKIKFFIRFNVINRRLKLQKTNLIG